MEAVYYIEINLICVFLTLGVMSQLRYRFTYNNAAKQCFNRLVIINMLYSISDMVANLANKSNFAGAYLVIQMSNMVYYACTTMLGYAWLMYINIRTNESLFRNSKKMFLCSVPLFVMCLLILINPFTEWLYSVSPDNVYSRENFVWLHWVISWSYLLTPTLQVILYIIKAKTKNERDEYMPLLSFVVFPILGGIIQMFFYGVTTMQVGTTFAIVIMTLMMLISQISTDDLTGLNNRRNLSDFLRNKIDHTDTPVYVVMCDINRFKSINDTYGHLEGDRAIKDAAQILKNVVGKLSGSLCLCRYGGDEFLAAGIGNDEHIYELFVAELEKATEAYSKSNTHPFTLDFSTGCAYGLCSNTEDAEALIKEADERMYEYKIKNHLTRK